LSFDKGIPLPSPKARWDFATAEPGDSLAFETEREANAFRAAAMRSGRFGTKKARHEGVWRVWLVEASKAPAHDVRSPQPPFLKAEVAAAFVPTSTETDDDIGLTVDLRRGESLRIVKPPEAQPVEPREAEAPKGGRRKRAAPVIPPPAGLSPTDG
jgi:hypothetical protein